MMAALRRLFAGVSSHREQEDLSLRIREARQKHSEAVEGIVHQTALIEQSREAVYETVRATLERLERNNAQ